ncbi:hypothetical protein [Terribacillus sp. JSM ZJ617]|uniref:hypothetical protein n=1 Tax=Terribacillus sp. JSM ZJ617 TaxID=3342119 RepID=UPI0035A8F472
MIPFDLIRDAKDEYDLRRDTSDRFNSALSTLGLESRESDVGIIIAKLKEFPEGEQKIKLGLVLFGTMYEDMAQHLTVEEDQDELLMIKLSDINSVPEVWYKGERIKPLYRLRLDWHTRTDEPLKDMNQLDITYIAKEDGPNFRTIGYNL